MAALKLASFFENASVSRASRLQCVRIVRFARSIYDVQTCSEEKRGPRPDETQLAEFATHLAGIAIAHENRRKILRDSEDRLRLAAEGSRIGIWSYDEATDEVVWDAATREMFYVPLDAKVTLETFYGALHPDDTARVREKWRRAVGGNFIFASGHLSLLGNEMA